MKFRRVVTFIFVIVCTATVASSALAQTTPAASANGGPSQHAAEPLSKKRLLKLLTLNDSTQPELIRIIEQKGVDFQPTPTDEKELRDAGAAGDLIVAVRANYRGGATSNSTPVSQQPRVLDANGPATQAPPNSTNGSAPAPKKKGFLGKLNQGLDKANVKMTKVAATLNPGVTDTTTKTSPVNPNTQTTTGPARPTNATTVPANASVSKTAGDGTPDSAPASLARTYWNVMSMTEKGETGKGTGAPGPDVEFCGDGKWGMLHYGGAREAGTYQTQGGRLIMKMEDGSLFGNFQITRNGNEMTLDDGKYVLRLKYIRPAGC